MTVFARKIGAAAGLGAAACMAATPAQAAELPQAAPIGAPMDMHGVFEADSGNAENHRGWRRYRRNRVDAGDVITGVLILGTIAAVASAANGSKKRYRDRRYEDRDNRPRRTDTQYRRNGEGARGLERAVDMCVSRIERDVRVDRVDNVSRSADGWAVTGSIYNGERFDCRIDGSGQISSVDYGSSFSQSSQYSAPRQVEDRQHSADRYSAAWDRVERQEAVQQASAQQQQPAYRPTYETADARYQPAEATYRGNTYPDQQQSAQQPAYPGGPIAGDEIVEAGESRARSAARTYVAQAGQ
jgi:hypothetical protein